MTEGDPVHTYLRGRGLILANVPEVLRLHPALDYWDFDDNGKAVKPRVHLGRGGGPDAQDACVARRKRSWTARMPRHADVHNGDDRLGSVV
ncbi:hypothetical protein [Variovorax sp. YR266]|uniref:hypothetical protein n=1 Tax=Variovorax sp. YR266 TaxID=1884386 RepID=UPI00115FF00D|nr:hypothetical protein [Variovorax sp. YR266]